MNGKTATDRQRRYWTDLVHVVGCIVCRRHHGHVRHDVCIHHVDGRTKARAHWYVLPLCAGHHQHGTGDKGLIGRHATLRDGGREAFEQAYEYEESLFLASLDILRGQGAEVPKGARMVLASILSDADVHPDLSFQNWIDAPDTDS